MGVRNARLRKLPSCERIHRIGAPLREYRTAPPADGRGAAIRRR